MSNWTKRLYVGNLPYSTTEQELEKLFAPYGGAKAAIPTDWEGRSKGFGFVNVRLDRALDAIHEVGGRELAGRELTVQEARPRGQDRQRVWDNQAGCSYGLGL